MFDSLKMLDTFEKPEVDMCDGSKLLHIMNDYECKNSTGRALYQLLNMTSHFCQQFYENTLLSF